MYFTNAHFLLTEECNLRCEYCYVRKKPKNMTSEVARKGVDFLINGAMKNNDHQILITFFGGEPTLRVDLMNEIFDYAISQCDKLYLEKNYRIKPGFDLITNAMNFSESVQKFLLKWRAYSGSIHVQLSLDGNPDVQRSNRPANNNAFDSGARMVDNLTKIQAFCEEHNIALGQEVYVHSVISKKSMPNLFDTYTYFTNFGFPGIWHCLVLEDDWDDNDVKLYDEQLGKIFDYCVENEKYDWLKFNKSFLNISQGKSLTQTCTAGRTLCAITPDGKIFPCHRFYEACPDDVLGYLDKDGHFWVDKTKKEYFESLTSDSYIGEKKCSECNIQGCYRCIGANAEHNILPNLCFAKYCKMARVEANYQAKTLDFLKEKGMLNFNNTPNKKECSCGGDCDHPDYSQNFADVYEVLNQLVNTHKEMANNLDMILQDMHDRINELGTAQKDLIDLIVALLLKLEDKTSE